MQPELGTQSDLFYDLFFMPVGGNQTVRLATPGVFNDTGDMTKLTYGGLSFPSFSLPPSDINHLRIIHASCRKPHGEGQDALVALDQMLESASIPASFAQNRPHQLFLTGDQIYADDVADPLLFMLIDASQTLLGWAEHFWDEYAAEMPSSKRGNLAWTATSTLVKSEKDLLRSHLLRLGEYYCMYLFAWSDVLWPTILSDFPSREQHSPDLDYQVSIDQTFPVESFRKTIPQIRRALANIPTYMIFDDHEVTDDWYLDKEWVATTLGNSVGTRIVQNGLTAYAIFQAWGNTPERFESGPGMDFLNAIDAWKLDPQENYDLVYNDLSFAYPYWSWIRYYLGVSLASQVAIDEEFVQNRSTSLYWHYSYEWDDHQVIVLDTRTVRSFKDNSFPFASLLSDAAFADQIPTLSPNAKVHIFIVPAPVITPPRVDSVQRNVSINRKERRRRDAEAWHFSEHAFEKLWGGIGNKMPAGSNGKKVRILVLSGDIHFGYACRLEQRARRNYESSSESDTHLIAAHLVASSCKNQTLDDYIGRVIQGGTGSLHYKGWVSGSDKVEDPKISMGWADPGPATSSQYTGGKVVGFYRNPPSAYPISGGFYAGRNPGVVNIGAIRFNNCTVEIDESMPLPEWTRRIDFLMDSSDQGDLPIERRFSTNPVEVPMNGSRQDALAEYFSLAKEYMSVATKWGDGKELVGANNIGELIFQWGNNESDKKVIQYLWWRLFYGTKSHQVLPPFPITKLEVPLGFDLPAYPNPNLKISKP